MVAIGDRVLYLPHANHSFNCNHNNEYPWVIGLKQNPHYETNKNTGDRDIVEDIVELEEGYLHRTVLPSIFNSPNPREERKKLVPLRPGRPWPAVVRGINADGTVDLDIASNVGSGMLTLHYNRVPLDETRSLPHSCFKESVDAGD